MRIWIPITLLFLLSNCGFTSQGNLIRDVTEARGAQAYDEGLVNAEWFLCEAASVGSIRRAYGGSQQSADAWRELCEGTDGVEIIGP
jgi:hypothetical protein